MTFAHTLLTRFYDPYPQVEDSRHQSFIIDHILWFFVSEAMLLAEGILLL